MDWDVSVYIQGRERISVPLPTSDFEGWGDSNKPKLTLSLSLQATCLLQLSSLDSVVLCHPYPSFHCRRGQCWCPCGLALVQLPTPARPGMREEGQSGKEMGWGGSNIILPKQIIGSSSFL